MPEQATSRLSVPQICELVVECLEEVLAERGDGATLSLGPDTRLLGADSVLDSLGLVALIVDVEDRLRSSHGASVTLADERAMSQTRSPFRTVQTLAAYIDMVLTDDG